MDQCLTVGNVVTIMYLCGVGVLVILGMILGSYHLVRAADSLLSGKEVVQPSNKKKEDKGKKK